MRKSMMMIIVAMIGCVSLSAVNLPQETTIVNNIPTGWTYVPNHPDYPTPDFYGSFGGLKLNYEGKGIESPTFKCVDSVRVRFTLASLFAKSTTVIGLAEHEFAVIAMDSNNVVLDTVGVDNIDAIGEYSVKVSAEDIAKVRVVMTKFPNVNGINHNVELTKVKITVPDSTDIDEVMDTIEVINIIDFYNAPYRDKMIRITGDMRVVVQNGKRLYLQDSTAALLIYGEEVKDVALVNGKVITGVVGRYNVYEDYAQMTGVTDWGTTSDSSLVMPFDADPAELMLGDMFEYVKFSNVIFASDAEYTTDGDWDKLNGYIHTSNGTMAIRNSFGLIEGNYSAGSVVNIEGIVNVFAENIQLIPMKIDLITTDADNVGIDEFVVYTQGKDIFVSTEVGTSIKVYSVQGTLLYSMTAISNITKISDIPMGVAVVMVGGNAVKVAVK